MISKIPLLRSWLWPEIGPVPAGPLRGLEARLPRTARCYALDLAIHGAFFFFGWSWGSVLSFG